MFIIKMDNGRGFVEWYASLSVRMQAESRQTARRFPSAEAAEKAADSCLQFPAAFAGAYFDSDRSCYTMQVVVEPL